MSLHSSSVTPVPRALFQDLDSQFWMPRTTLNITAFSSRTIKVYHCLADQEQQETPADRNQPFNHNYSYLITLPNEAK